MFEVAKLDGFNVLHAFSAWVSDCYECAILYKCEKTQNGSHRRLTIKSLPFFQWKTIFSSLLLHLQRKEKRHFRQYGQIYFRFTLWPRKTPYQEALWDDRRPALWLHIFRKRKSDAHQYTTNSSNTFHHCASAFNFLKCQRVYFA